MVSPQIGRVGRSVLSDEGGRRSIALPVLGCGHGGQGGFNVALVNGQSKLAFGQVN